MKRVLIAMVLILALATIATGQEWIERFGWWNVYEVKGTLLDEGYIAVIATEGAGSVILFPEVEDGKMVWPWKLGFPEYLGGTNEIHEQALVYATNLTDGPKRIEAGTLYRGESHALYMTSDRGAFLRDEKITEVIFRTWDYTDQNHDIVITDWDAAGLQQAMEYAAEWYGVE